MGRRPRRVLVSGSNGLIGSRAVASFEAVGDTVVRLVREGATGPDRVCWNPLQGGLEPALVSGFDVVVHLAGEPLAGRWTADKKRRIVESRMKGTAGLAAALAAAERPPGLFLCASGINFYGNQKDTVVDEDTPQGNSFLAEACVAWEGACAPLAGISRVVNLRIGVVLDAKGGTLALMLPLYRMGLGGTVAGGRGYISWVTLGDLVRAIHHAVASEGLQGPLNVVAPTPVTGREFARALGAAVGRPAVIPVPGWLAHLMMGELADETVLGSVRAVPRRLLEDGFRFRDVTLREALAACGVG